MNEENKPITPSIETSTDKPNGRHDVITHRIVVISLGLAVLASALDITILQIMGQQASSELTYLGSTAIGALAMALGKIMQSD